MTAFFIRQYQNCKEFLSMSKSKVTFGTMATCEVRYAIIKVSTNNKIRFVTDVEFYPKKYCEWKGGQKAKLFSDRKSAEDICFGLNVNGYGCFVMEVPDYFNDDQFINEEDKESEENV